MQRYLSDLWRIFSRSPLSIIGLIVILLLLTVAFLAPYISPYNPVEPNPVNRLAGPSPSHLFGTDQLGRDTLSRTLYGARISLRLAIIIAVLGGGIGVTVGIIAGYAGVLVDNLLMRTTDIFMAFPRLVLAMAISAVLGPSLQNVIIAIALYQWTIYARLARSKVLEIRDRDFVEAAKASGASRRRILIRHIFPMCLPPIAVQLSIDMGGIIRTAASMGFLGLGAQPPTPEWGVMVTAGRNYIPNQWWVSTFPGLAIFITVLGFNLLGDGLRDILDPRMRGK